MFEVFEPNRVQRNQRGVLQIAARLTSADSVLISLFGLAKELDRDLRRWGNSPPCPSGLPYVSQFCLDCSLVRLEEEVGGGALKGHKQYHKYCGIRKSTDSISTVSCRHTDTHTHTQTLTQSRLW